MFALQYYWSLQHYWLKDCRTQPLLNWPNWARVSYDKRCDVLWPYFTQDIEYFWSHPHKISLLIKYIFRLYWRTLKFTKLFFDSCKHLTQNNWDHSMCIVLRLNVFVSNYFPNKNYIVYKAENNFLNESEKRAFLAIYSKTK